MGNTITDTRKKGRPKIGAVQVQVRIPPELLGSLDAYIEDSRPGMSRPEVIRLIMSLYLSGHEDRSAAEAKDARSGLGA